MAALLGSRIAAAAPIREPVSLSLLTYNVHGLSWMVARDDPRARMPAIGRLSSRYDVVLYQEDFEYHDVLRKQLRGYTSFRGNGLGSDPRRMLMKALMTPFALARLSPQRAVIVAGDFNLSSGTRWDEASMSEFRQRLGLVESGMAPELAVWHRHDCILYRDGPETGLELESAGEATEFVRKTRPLSDHAALYARFLVYDGARVASRSAGG